MYLLLNHTQGISKKNTNTVQFPIVCLQIFIMVTVVFNTILVVFY